jgi:hypothetical protein
MHWQVLQTKTFLVVWGQHLGYAGKKTDEDGDETVLETQDWYWEEPYEAWDLDIGRAGRRVKARTMRRIMVSELTQSQ